MAGQPILLAATSSQASSLLLIPLAISPCRSGRAVSSSLKEMILAGKVVSDLVLFDCGNKYDIRAHVSDRRDLVQRRPDKCAELPNAMMRTCVQMDSAYRKFIASYNQAKYSTLNRKACQVRGSTNCGLSD